MILSQAGHRYYLSSPTDVHTRAGSAFDYSVTLTFNAINVSVIPTKLCAHEERYSVNRSRIGQIDLDGIYVLGCGFPGHPVGW